jgi:hypothetical protein
MGARMTPDQARKLLGGYATGTLTSEEQRALFEAALLDQALFDELAREQALREALDDSTNRAELLRALDDAGEARQREHIMGTPRRRWWVWGLAGSGALAAAAVTVFVLVNTDLRSRPPQVAAVRTAPDALSGRVAQPAAPAAESAAVPRVERSPARASKQIAPHAPSEEQGRVAETPPALPPIVPEAVTATGAPPPAPAIRAATPAARDAAAPSAMYRTEAAEARTNAVTAQPRAKVASALRAGAAAASFAPAEFELRYSVQPEEPAPGAHPEISVETSVPAYVYAFRRLSPGGEWAALNPGGTSVAAGLKTTLPQAGDADAVLLIASRRPIQDLAAAGGELTAAVERVRETASRPLVSRNIPPKSTSIVQGGAGPDARIVVTIPLPRPR